MSTVFQVVAAAPSFRRLQKPNPRLTARRQGGTDAVMAWICKQSEASAALGVIGGTTETITCMGASVSRIVPLRHPAYPWLIADEVTAEDFGWEAAGGGVPAETDTKITVVFKSPSWDMSGSQSFLEFVGQGSSRMIPAPQGAYQSGHQPGETTAGEQANGADFQLILHQVPSFNLGTLCALMNTTNNATFYGNPAGTVLFLGPSWQIQQQLGGVLSWRVGLGFKATDPNRPWNYGYLSDNTWGQILKADGSLRYPLVDPTSWIAV